MGVKITDGFGPGDDEKAVSILKKWKGGVISDKLFTVLAGMVPTTGVVIVFLYNKKDPEVLFVPRPNGDPLWSGMLNLPGKLFRKIDFARSDQKPINGPLERIETAEIGTKLPKRPKFAGINLNSDKRGSWAILVYFIELNAKSEYKGVGEWVKVYGIKKRSDVIQTEINHINIALKKFV